MLLLNAITDDSILLVVIHNYAEVVVNDVVKEVDLVEMLILYGKLVQLFVFLYLWGIIYFGILFLRMCVGNGEILRCPAARRGTLLIP